MEPDLDDVVREIDCGVHQERASLDYFTLAAVDQRQGLRDRGDSSVHNRNVRDMGAAFAAERLVGDHPILVERAPTGHSGNEGSHYLPLLHGASNGSHFGHDGKGLLFSPAAPQILYKGCLRLTPDGRPTVAQRDELFRATVRRSFPPRGFVRWGNFYPGGPPCSWSLQFPISDSRAFATSQTTRLDVPDWPDPRTYGNPQFVRRFGPAAERSLGPDAAWTDERIYCRARRAIGFPELRRARLRAGEFTVRPFLVFRRLICDRTTAVARVEVGIVGSLPAYAPSLVPAAVESLVRDVLALNTDVFDLDDGVVRADLSEQGRRLARLFAFATSRRKLAAATPQELDLVQFGRPVVIAEFDDGEVLALPKHAQAIGGTVTGDAELVFYDERTRGGRVPVWVLRRGTTPEPVLRSLRLCLLRLHAERECLDRVLAHVQASRIVYTGRD